MKQLKHFWKLFLLAIVFSGCQLTAQEQNILPQLSGENFNFMVAGDMGRRGESEQQNIADLMGKMAETGKIRLLAVAGDPIHDDGVKNINDEEWKLKIENIYTAPSLHAIPWYVVSGNHEYNGSVQAILDYSNVSKRWNAPARYFSLEQTIDSTGQKCLLVFIDTSPLIDKYRTEEKYSDAGEQDMDAQLQWIEETLALSDARWKIVIGHHPVYAGTNKTESERTDLQERLNPILVKNDVDVYVCGHIHNFQHIRSEVGNVNYIVNSSASRSRPIEKNQEMLFGNPDPGFSVFSVSANNIEFYAINHTGETVYNYVIK